MTSAETDPIKGFLSKKNTGWFAGTTREFWVLDPSKATFCSYKNPGDTGLDHGQTRTIKASNILKVQKKSGGLKFAVVLAKEILLFSCKSEQERNDWVDKFTYVLLNVVDDSTLPTAQMVQSTAASRKSDGKALKRIDTSPQSLEDGGRREQSDSNSPSPAGTMSRNMSRRMMAGDAATSPSASGPDLSAKKDANIKDQIVFMGKARNFAVSINKETSESIKKKGAGYSAQATGDGAGGDGAEGGAKRARVIPLNIPEEAVDESRFVKDETQNAMLLKVVSVELADFMGGNLFKEVRAQAVVDLMFSVAGSKNTNIVTQGEPTDRLYVIESGEVGVYTQDFIDRPPELEVVKKPGEFFGALSLLYNQPGPFTIKCHDDCVLWALPRKKFHDLTTNETKRRIGRKIHLLEGVPLIKDNLDQNNIVALADVLEYQTLQDGQFLVTRGETLSKMWIVSEGIAQMMDGDTVVDELGKGEAFGDWALLDITQKADMTLKASGQLVVLTLTVSEIEELVGPLRTYVSRRWAEQKGSQFFFSNAPRGGTVFDPESDIRNPLSRANATVQFGAPGAATTNKLSAPGAGTAAATAAANNTTTATNTATIPEHAEPPQLSKEEEEILIKEAIQAAKARATTTDKRNTKAAGSATTPTTTTPAAVSTTTPAATPAPVEEDTAAGGEVESDDGGGEEQNLDKPFDYAAPVRPDLVMKSIKCCALLGRGNFGRVHLCRAEANHKELFALKVLARSFIVQNGWEILVENERNAMLELSGLTRSPFLLMLYNSFSDMKNVYLLLELCEGGDLYNLLRVTKGNRFNEEVARFYMSCVVMGLEAMHSRELVYRDLKPENLMLSRNGYIKVADFGLVKKTLRTYTVCGTPDYMAPEVILSRGHALPVDWWAIGILLYEMVGAVTPFFGEEATDIYENVLAHEEEDDLEFPREVTFSKDAQDLIRRLLHPKKNRRLGILHPGVKAVKTHSFFECVKFDWDSLSKQTMKPPIMPNAVDMSKYTTGNITYDPKLYNTPDDHSGWKLNF